MKRMTELAFANCGRSSPISLAYSNHSPLRSPSSPSASTFAIDMSGHGKPPTMPSTAIPRPAARDEKDVSSTSVHLASRQRHQPSAATRLLEQGVHWTLISRAYERIMGFPSQWSAVVYAASEMRFIRKSPK